MARERCLPCTNQVSRHHGKVVLGHHLAHPRTAKGPVGGVQADGVDARQCVGLADEIGLETALLKGVLPNLIGVHRVRDQTTARVDHHQGALFSLILDNRVSSGQTAHWLLWSTTGLDFAIYPTLVHQGDGFGHRTRGFVGGDLGGPSTRGDEQ